MVKNLRKIVLTFCVCAIFFSIIGISIDIVDMVTVARYLSFSWTVGIIESIVELCGIILLTYWAIKSKTRFALLVGSGLLLAVRIPDIAIAVFFDGPGGFFLQALIETICLILLLIGIKMRKDKFIGIIMVALGVSQWFYIYRCITYFPFSYTITSVASITFILINLSTGLMYVAFSCLMFLYGSNMLLMKSPSNTTTLHIGTDSISARLDAVNADYQAGLISQEEYKHRRMEILKTLGK